jgi:hypothetical protein
MRGESLAWSALAKPRVRGASALLPNPSYIRQNTAPRQTLTLGLNSGRMQASENALAPEGHRMLGKLFS